MDERKRIFRLTRWILILTGIAGLTFASYAAYIYVSLKQISDPKKCFTTSMYKVYLCPSSQSYIRFQQVPQHFIRALILSEDTSFYSHKGLDWFEIKESFRRNFQEWKFARGGSTITQQLAKNLYLSSEKSIDRKIKEFFLAQQIEKYLNKNQILEKYVNVVEFGPNIFGIDKASRHYFGKAVESLNVLESVYLVSLLPSPKRYSKSFKTQKLSRINISRMKIILGRMYRTHRITDEVYVFSETLIDTYDWPFPHYSNPFQEAEDTIQNELMEEFNEMEDNQEEPEFEDEVKQAVQEAENETEENFEPIPEASESEIENDKAENDLKDLPTEENL